MTIEEKLEKAIKFIKYIENLDLNIYTTQDIIDNAHAYCEDCGEQTQLTLYGENENFVNAKDLQNLKDKAWHLLADLTD